MKYLILLAALCSIGLFSCKKSGCIDPQALNYNSEAQKDDGSCIYKPSILINGATIMDVNLGSTYSDLGASATNEDGSSVSVETDLSQVNTTKVGSFLVTYTATNDYGTSTDARTVNVVIGQENWLGSPTVTNDCNNSLFPLAEDPIITAGTSSSDIIINKMFSLAGGTAAATVNGQTITIPQQTINITIGDIIFSGSGSMNDNGTLFTVIYSYENTTPVVGGSGTCTVNYTF